MIHCEGGQDIINDSNSFSRIISFCSRVFLFNIHFSHRQTRMQARTFDSGWQSERESMLAYIGWIWLIIHACAANVHSVQYHRYYILHLVGRQVYISFIIFLFFAVYDVCHSWCAVKPIHTQCILLYISCMPSHYTVCCCFSTILVFLFSLFVVVVVVVVSFCMIFIGFYCLVACLK